VKYLFSIDQKDICRVLLHIPVGMFTCFAGYVAWWLAVVFATGFLLYEMNEDWHIKDEAWKDIKGYLWGIVIGSLILFAMGI